MTAMQSHTKGGIEGLHSLSWRMHCCKLLFETGKWRTSWGSTDHHHYSEHDGGYLGHKEATLKQPTLRTVRDAYPCSCLVLVRPFGKDIGIKLCT